VQDDYPGQPHPRGEHHQQEQRLLQPQHEVEQEGDGGPHKQCDSVLPHVGVGDIDISDDTPPQLEVGHPSTSRFCECGEAHTGPPSQAAGVRHQVQLGDILDVAYEGDPPDLCWIYPPTPDTRDAGVNTPSRRRRRRTVGVQTSLGGRCTARQRLGWPY
jgi:hypothetical protein